MKSGTNKLLAFSCLLSAILAATLLIYLGEPAPLDPPTLHGVITGLFAFNALGFLMFPPWGTRRHAAVGAIPSSEVRGWKWTAPIVLLSLTIVGFALRFFNVQEFGLCPDEALFVFASGHDSLREMFRESITHFHPPTNFLILHYLLKISWNVAWIRLPSIIGGTLAIGCTFLFVRSLFGTLAGLISAFLVTFSPNLILLSQVCRNYSPSLPFLLLALYFAASYLREPRNSRLAGFAAFEFLAVLWHYALLPVFLGVNVVLLTILLWDRSSLRQTGLFLLTKIPITLLYTAAFFLHLPVAMRGQRVKVINYMKEEFYLDWANPFKQLLAVVKYLVADYPQAYALIPTLLVIGGVLLACLKLGRLGLRRQVVFCTAFLPFSYLLAFGFKLLPFGGTRHSFYVFPFVFALVSGYAAFLVEGEGRLRAELRLPQGGREEPRTFSGRAAVLVAMACTAFLWKALALHLDSSSYHLRQSPQFRERVAFYKADFYKAVELPTRVADLNRLENGLMRLSSPGDYVLVALPTLMILQARWVPPPHSVSFDLMKDHEFEFRGRHFIQVRNNALGFSSSSLMTTVATLAREKNLADSDRVWIALAGWEAWSDPVPGWIATAFPASIDESKIDSESGDMLFAVKVGAARHYAQILRGWNRRLAPVWETRFMYLGT